MRRFLGLCPLGAPGGFVAAGSAQFSGSNNLAQGAGALQWDGLSNFTVALFFRVTTLPTAGQNMWIFSQTSDPQTRNGYGLRLNGSTGFLNFECSGNVGGGQNPYRTVPNMGIVQGRWYMCDCIFNNPFVYCSVMDATTGAVQAPSVGWTTPGVVGAASFTLGAGPGGVDSGGLTCVNLVGDIDNVGWWARNITGAEEATLQNVVAGKALGVDWAAISGGSLNDAQCWWGLDQFPAPNVVDLRDSTAHKRLLVNTGNVVSGPERDH